MISQFYSLLYEKTVHQLLTESRVLLCYLAVTPKPFSHIHLANTLKMLWESTCGNTNVSIVPSRIRLDLLQLVEKKKNQITGRQRHTDTNAAAYFQNTHAAKSWCQVHGADIILWRCFSLVMPSSLLRTTGRVNMVFVT